MTTRILEGDALAAPGGSAISRPVMRYHGGKFRLAPWLLSFFPPHMVYVEPFGGAASVLIQKPRSHGEVYNDLDGDIVNVFRVLQNQCAAARLAELLTVTPYARDEFDLAFEPSDESIERARRTIIRAEMGFGSAGATKGKTGFRVDTGRHYGTAMSVWATIPNKITSFAARLQGVLIENRDALAVIGQHDTTQTLFFVDPPYLHSTREVGARHGRYYQHELTDDDHYKLLETLRAVAGMVVVSGYPSALYDAALTGWVRRETKSRIAASRGTRTRTEVVWLNPACCDGLKRRRSQAGLFADATLYPTAMLGQQ